jgi:hypothetical protein
LSRTLSTPFFGTRSFSFSDLPDFCQKVTENELILEMVKWISFKDKHESETFNFGFLTAYRIIDGFE